MNKIFRDPVYRADLPKHGFPMNQSKKVTASFGHLLPVYYDILNAGEKIRFKSRWFTRTQPLSTAAMVRCREHVEYFFVPFEQLYSLFGSFRYGINDIHSDLVQQPVPNLGLPRVSWSTLQTYLDTHAYDIAGGLVHDSEIMDDSKYDNLWSGAYRLFDLLGYDVACPSNRVQMSGSVKFSPYMLCAYQKIFNDVYRLDDYTSPIVRAYNMDSGYTNSDWQPDISELCSIRYRPFYKDYFTVTKPSPLVNGKSMLEASDTSQLLAGVNQWLSSSNYALSPRSLESPSSTEYPDKGNIQSVSYQMGIDGQLNAVSAPQLRTMFAIEKLAQITGRAGKHYDAQTLAHFGFDVPRGITGEVYRLGGQSQTLQIGEVVSTSSTDKSVLGELAGKAYSITQNAEDNEFTAPADGIFMAIYSCVPELNYLSRPDKLCLRTERYDFYLPEFDNLGMQPLFAYEYWGTLYNSVSRSRVVGWQYRYQESKAKYNTATSAFEAGAPFADWTLHLDVNDLGLNVDEMSLYCNPKIMDTVFLVNYDGHSQRESGEATFDYANYVYGTDPLIIDFDFEVSKASYMSPYGIPNL